MQYIAKSRASTKFKADCIIIGLHADGRLTLTGQAFDKQSGGRISAHAKAGRLPKELGQTRLLLDLPNVDSGILVVGLGDNEHLREQDYKSLFATSYGALGTINAKHVINSLLELTVEGRDALWKARRAAQAFSLATYQFSEYQSKAKRKKDVCQKMTFLVEEKKHEELVAAELAIGDAIAQGMMMVKDLGNTPPNICDPEFLAKYARKMAKDTSNLSAKILDEVQMERLGMNTILSVAQGSEKEARLICLHYKGGEAREKPVVFLGKGITFDTGGNSMKPSTAMLEMKYDMLGAAIVMATIQVIANLKLPLNVVAVVASAENMVSERATRPSDIITTMSGQTVEITNTDAEGRLVLCDALTYVERYKPAVVIDVATLTGAMIIALGHEMTGLFSNDDALAEELEHAGSFSGDDVWRMPISKAYHKELESNYADFTNCASRTAASITAACFLEKFASDYRWAHLDVAGTALTRSKQTGKATGRIVPLLVQYCLNRCQKKAARVLQQRVVKSKTKNKSTSKRKTTSKRKKS